MVFSEPLEPARPETRPLWDVQGHTPVHSPSFPLSGRAECLSGAIEKVLTYAVLECTNALRSTLDFFPYRP